MLDNNYFANKHNVEVYDNVIWNYNYTEHTFLARGRFFCWPQQLMLHGVHLLSPFSSLQQCERLVVHSSWCATVESIQELFGTCTVASLIVVSKIYHIPTTASSSESRFVLDELDQLACLTDFASALFSALSTRE